MDSGYVYLLINPAMPGMLKVGSTLRDSRTRASRLRTTGVPMPFEVAFEVFTEGFKEIESEMHRRLDNVRVISDREFFRYPLKDAINLLLDLQRRTREPEANFSALSIFQRLKDKYPPHWFQEDIVDVRLIQTDELTWLEITRESILAHGRRNQIIQRTDLSFVAADGGPAFDHRRPIVENARQFTEDLPPLSVHVIADIFNDVGHREIPKD